jgi:hypothetical protein
MGGSTPPYPPLGDGAAQPGLTHMGASTAPMPPGSRAARRSRAAARAFYRRPSSHTRAAVSGTLVTSAS